MAPAGVPDRRGLLGDRRRQGAARARHPLRLLREVRSRRRQLGVRQPQRHVRGLSRPVHQHLAPAHGVLGLPDARVLSGLPPPHPDRGVLRGLRRPLRPARADHLRDRRASTPSRDERTASGRSSSTRGETRGYDALLVANGHHWNPRWPEPAFPGADTLHGHAAARALLHRQLDLRRQAGGRARHGQLGDGHRRRVLLRRRAHLPGGAPGASGSSPSTCSANRSISSATTRASPSRSASGSSSS